ncbi:hypothetical protein [Hwanghaeella sp.]|uniref:hypothetical protein n=1 Tax=Hwanghaeella sp. TaxID=2605943 RepID=UPI003CCB8C53
MEHTKVEFWSCDVHGNDAAFVTSFKQAIGIPAAGEVINIRSEDFMVIRRDWSIDDIDGQIKTLRCNVYITETVER